MVAWVAWTAGECVRVCDAQDAKQQNTGAVRAVPTFHCVGIRWKPELNRHSSPTPVARVRYRTVDVTENAAWVSSFPLWFDPRNGEFRGSVVQLDPGTRYQFELKLVNKDSSSTSPTQHFQVATWPQTFPVAKTVSLPKSSNTMLKIRDSGTQNGYVLYCPKRGARSTIDVRGNEDACIRVAGSYVILSGVNLRNAAIHAIYLDEGVHDVIIEDCDISGWGRIEKDGWGRNHDGAVFSRSRTTRRIVVQGNYFHHPRSDANSWAEPRPLRGDPRNRHPAGPQVVYLAQSQGNHVFRFNTVTSDEDHQFNDIFGAAENYSRVGFPNCDSDIYSNYLSHCWDDAIESEGANRNVRIWQNYITNSYIGIATATTSEGPLYVWRNVMGVSRKSPGKVSRENRGAFMKHSDRMGGGRIDVFHNTLLQGSKLEVKGSVAGCGTGLGWGGPMLNVTSRNNLFPTQGVTINDRNKDPHGDYDFDLFDGPFLARAGSQTHGIRGTPQYQSRNGLHRKRLTGDFSLRPGSPGHDAGQRIPGFNDAFFGKAPDMGAHESGAPPMQFGTTAMPEKWKHR